ATLVIASRKEDPLRTAAATLCQWGTCTACPCDIRQPEQVAILADHIAATHGRLDILVNNAGGQFPAPAELMAPKGWASVINNNLNGTFYVSQQMLNRFFKPQNSGVVINIIAAIMRGFPGMSHTAAARAGVDNLTKSLAQEWAAYGVRVNAIAPGIIDSSGLETYPDFIQSYFDKMREDHLQGRFGTVEEVAHTAVYYASPMSQFVNGTTLHVDGGDHLAGSTLEMFRLLRSFL
ncbi:MAG: SDR family oxidoreductase, partial [Bacteroidota bacterium]